MLALFVIRVLAYVLFQSQLQQSLYTLVAHILTTASFNMFQNIKFHIIRNLDSEISDLTDMNPVLFGAETEIPGRLARLLQLPPDHTDFRAFATREQAMDSSNNGHSVLQICQQIGKDSEAVAGLLKSCHFVFTDSGETAVAFVRAGDSASVVASSAKPQPTKSKLVSMSTEGTISSARRRLPTTYYSLIDKIVTQIWPRDASGMPLKARDRAGFGGKENRCNNHNGKNPDGAPTTTPSWVKTHLVKAFSLGDFPETDVATLVDTATK